MSTAHQATRTRPEHSEDATAGPQVVGERSTRRSSSLLPDLPALDGLRALAVAAVVVYHAEIGLLRGGFLGVEVFLVISGYLITSLLVAEWSRDGYIDLRQFWLRRARRLLPALYAVMAATLAYAVLFAPAEAARLKGDTLAALAYVTNWYLTFSGDSYFEAVSSPNAFQHLWSLAIEEQFYLLWPLALAAALALWGGASARVGRIAGAARARLPLAIAAAAAVSAALAALLYDPAADTSRIYYGTDTRAAGLLIGAALAFVSRPRYREAKWPHARSAAAHDSAHAFYRSFGARPAARFLEAGAISSLAILAICSVTLTEEGALLYRGGLVAVALATAVLIASVVHPFSHQTFAWRALSSPAARWVGLRSYGIYLWHWPVFVFSRPGVDIPLQGTAAFVARVGAVLVLAALSYRFIETPVRRGAIGRHWRALRRSEGPARRRLRRRWAAATAPPAVGLAALALAVGAAQPPAQPDYLAKQSVSTSTGSAKEEPADEGPPAKDGGEGGAPEHDRGAGRDNAPASAGPKAGPLVGAETGSPGADPGSSRQRSEQEEPADKGPEQEQSATADRDGDAAKGENPSRKPGEVTVVGDSVMVGAADEVESSLLEDGAESVTIRASQGLQASEARSIVSRLQREGELGDTLILAVGNNGYFTEGQISSILEASVGSSSRVVLVNNRVPRGWQDPNNAAMEDAASGDERVVLADWYDTSAGRNGLLYTDGIHLRPEAAPVYARLITSRL